MSARGTVAAATAVISAVAVLAWLAGAEPYRAVGDADPGWLVAMGTPAVRAVADLAAAVCAGSLVFACTTRPAEAGVVGPMAYRELRVAGRAAAVWVLAALAEIPLSAADTAGLPLPDVVRNLPGLLGAMETPRAWLIVVVAAVAVTFGCASTLRWPTLAGLLGLVLFGLLPPVVTGHGSADLGHDLALGALILHVPAAAGWLGLLVTAFCHRHELAPAVLIRIRRATTGCWLLVTASGLMAAFAVAPTGWFGSWYGWDLLAKVVIAAALGAASARRTFWRGEAILLLAAFAISVDLTHQPLPGFFSRARTTAETVLGYDLAGPPTALRLILDWRIDVFWAPMAVALAVGYLLALRRAGAWPRGRTAAWLTGCLVLLLATSSGVGRYAAAMLSVHMVAHMLLSMLVPALLALGAPLTLFRAAVPATTRLDALVGSGPVRLFTHPVTALLLFAGSPFAVYLTGVFDIAARFHWAHLALDAWFLVVGYLFFWPVIGPDPVPRPLPNLARLGVLLAAMPADVLFGAAVLTTSRLIGNGPGAAQMYQALALPWVPDLAADQRLAGLLALAVGEVALLIALGALLARWHDDVPRVERREIEEQWRRTNATR